MSMSAGRILIVEDEPVLGELVREILTLHAFDPLLATNGADAVRQAPAWKPDALVLDLMLPDLDGFEVCRLIRQQTEIRQPGILMLTGMATSDARMRGFQAGADRYMLKPFQVVDLVQEVRSVLVEYDGGHGLRRRIELELSSRTRVGEQILSLLLVLTRATPLSTQEIEAIGRELRWLADHAAQDAPADWRLVIRVFRDRIEATLLSTSGRDPMEVQQRFLNDPSCVGVAYILRSPWEVTGSGESLTWTSPYRLESSSRG
jgi:DNA-binding response OmpR family regulator